ncbi:MAG: CTP-dependent riboflavin kinase, partial [archaeon]|nr:CTP-dependent riboflavin kinase [archaeon]
DPYIGTLNLKLTSSKDRKLRHELEHYSGISIDGFKNEHRTYGGAKCFMAVVNDLVEGAVGVFERSHYDDSVLEVISPIKIREKLGLKDGDRVKVKVFLESPSKPKIH